MNKNTFNIISPSNNLYDRIILAIQKEKESQKIKKLVILLSILFCFSLGFTITSIIFFIKAWQNSGISYIIKTAVSDVTLFLTL